MTGATVSFSDRVKVGPGQEQPIEVVPDVSLGRRYKHFQPGGDPVADLRHAREIKSLGWPENA